MYIVLYLSMSSVWLLWQIWTIDKYKAQLELGLARAFTRGSNFCFQGREDSPHTAEAAFLQTWVRFGLRGDDPG